MAMEVEELSSLVAAAAAGEHRAWERLVEHFSGLVWSIAGSYGLGRADAADVVQVTWLRLVEHLGRLKDPTRVGAWLVTTARRGRQSRRSWRTSGPGFCGDRSGSSASGVRSCCGRCCSPIRR